MSEKYSAIGLKKFTYKDKMLVIYDNESVLLINSTQTGRYIQSLSYRTISKEYNDVFNEVFPSLEDWKDTEGNSKIYDYITFKEETKTDKVTKVIMIDHPGYGKQIIKYDELEMYSEQLDSIADTLKEISDKLGNTNESISSEIEEEYNHNETELYTRDNFNKDIYGSVNYIKDIEPLIKVKSNTMDKVEYTDKILALQGSVGTGKSTIALAIARTVVGFKNSYRISMVNFNPSIDYCDLYMGLKPSPGKVGQIEEKPGIIKIICDRALAEPDKQFVLIIDEFNRDDFNRIGGPLLSCIASRGVPQYLDGTNTLCMPSNLLLIVTMNTSDQSTTSLDRALRDRMIPINMNKKKWTDKFKATYEYLLTQADYRGVQPEELRTLVKFIDSLNDDLRQDTELGSDALISFRPIDSYIKSRNFEASIDMIEETIEYLDGRIGSKIMRSLNEKLQEVKNKYHLS